MNLSYRLAWVGALGCAVVVTACSGDPFCQESRTCQSNGAAEGGGAGVAADEPLAGSEGEALAGASGQGAGGIGTEPGAAGEGGSGEILPVDCVTDDDCDDGKACNGFESCSANKCQAGEAVECASGMKCSEAAEASCQFPSDAPWVVYTGDEDADATFDLWAAKLDLLGKMAPVKLSPTLAKGYSVVPPNGYAADGMWSPDSKTLLFTGAKGSLAPTTYAVHFGAGLPDAPLTLSQGQPIAATLPIGSPWSADGKAITVAMDDGLYIVDYPPVANVAPQKVTNPGFLPTNVWWKSATELVHVSWNAATSTADILVSTRGQAGWTTTPIKSSVALIARQFGYAEISPDRNVLMYYTAASEVGGRALYAIKTVPGSVANKVSGANTAYAIVAPNSARYALFEDDNSTLTTISIGTGGVDTVRKRMSLGTVSSFSLYFAYGPWSPDSSRLLYFVDSTWADTTTARQAAIYTVGATTNPPAIENVTDAQQLNLYYPSWSPDGKWIAAVTRTSANSDMTLKLISAADPTQTRDLDTVAPSHEFSTPLFSANSQFFFYTKGVSNAATSYEAGYLDLSTGLNANSKAVPPGQGTFSLFSGKFVPRTTAFVYQRNTVGGGVCRYLDMADATTVVQLEQQGSASGCNVQPPPL
jgi:hypothetical protein